MKSSVRKSSTRRNEPLLSSIREPRVKLSSELLPSGDLCNVTNIVIKKGSKEHHRQNSPISWMIDCAVFICVRTRRRQNAMLQRAFFT